ncbi:plasma membrane fusion protein PRM1 [Coprinopsis sp. MPI-PUGE-AT-0042]|nr:plasma membrane fusion protein PRM1 [Coprinopsis sp. MPI-PUGE-AT-0042]
MSTTLTPYLQLPHLLSLTWLAYPILSIIFVAFRLHASLDSSQDTIASAKANLLASCKAAEQAATSAASMPRYMAIASNEQVVDAVNGTLRAARATLVMSLTIMEAVINFIIDLYRSIFLCFLELIVRAGLAVITAAVEEIDKLIGTVTSGLRTRIQEDIGSANNVIKGFIDGLNRVNPFSDIEAPQIPIPNLDGLENVSLPAEFTEGLEKLSDTIPSVSTIKEKLEEIINKPFELLKADINDTFAGISFNSSTLPVPEQHSVAFCQDMDLSVVDDVGNDIVKTAKIGVILLIVIALVLIGLNCLLTWYKWRCMKSHLEYTRQAWNTDPTMHTKGSLSATPQVVLNDHNLMMLQANSEHPLITRITNQISSLLKLSPRTHTHMQWFFNYIFHGPAAACFMIGLFGILLVQIQLIAMAPLVKSYQERSAEATKDFTALIANSINNNMLNQSRIYAAEVNAQVDVIQTSINDGVFGWVDGTIVPLNTTLNEFYDDVQRSVQTVFGGTILEEVARNFIQCIIGTKVDAVENALTFLHENLNIQFPRVNDTALMLSPESVDEAAAPIASAAMGGGTDDSEGLVGRIVNSYANSLKKERVTFAIFLGIWGIVVLMGLFVLFWHSVGMPFMEKRRRQKFEREHRSGLPAGFTVPYRDSSSSPVNEKRTGSPGLAVVGDELPEFTPLPSPKREAFKPFWMPRSNTPDSQQERGEVPHNRSAENLVSPVKDDGKVSRLKAIRAKLAMKKEHEKKDSEQSADYWDAQPQLKVIVDTPSDLAAARRAGEQEESRGATSSWAKAKKLLSPPTSKKDLPEASTGSSMRRKPSTASGIGASLDDPFVSTYGAPSHPPLIPSPYPIPLHTGYQTNPQSITTLAPAPPKRFLAPYPPPAPSSQSSAGSPRRNPSNTWRVTNLAPSDQMSTSSIASLPLGLNAKDLERADSPTSRLLTSRPKESANVNPFMSPFDDEHRVEVVPSHPMNKRQSVNPFNGVAI